MMKDKNVFPSMRREQNLHLDVGSVEQFVWAMYYNSINLSLTFKNIFPNEPRQIWLQTVLVGLLYTFMGNKHVSKKIEDV